MFSRTDVASGSARRRIESLFPAVPRGFYSSHSDARHERSLHLGVPLVISGFLLILQSLFGEHDRYLYHAAVRGGTQLRSHSGFLGFHHGAFRGRGRGRERESRSSMPWLISPESACRR